MTLPGTSLQAWSELQAILASSPYSACASSYEVDSESVGLNLCPDPRPQGFIQLRVVQQDVQDAAQHDRRVQRLGAHGRVCVVRLHDRVLQLGFSLRRRAQRAATPPCMVACIHRDDLPALNQRLQRDAGSGPSSKRQHQMPHGFGRGPHLDFNVITQAVQAVHELALRQVGKVTAQHG